MVYSLYNRNKETLRFDMDEPYIEVVDNKYLPYALRDYVETTGRKDMKGSMHDLTVLRDYLASRTLNLSRENAKVILNVSHLPQSLNTEQRLKIVLACNGLSMQDNFWLKPEGREAVFDDMCLRHHRLSEVSYDIAILGRHISATADELIPDLTTEGMFPKYWHRAADGSIELWKTDKTGGRLNSECEVQASEILDSIGYRHVKYRREERGDKIFSVCKCIADDDNSFIPIQDIIDWHDHTRVKFPEQISDIYDRYFPDMCAIDYILANTDRHNGNWGVMVNTENEITGFAPMFDLNQALVADHFNTDIRDLIYEPTGLTFEDSVLKWAPYSKLELANGTKFSEKVTERIEHISDIQRQKK